MEKITLSPILKMVSAAIIKIAGGKKHTNLETPSKVWESLFPNKPMPEIVELIEYDLALQYGIKSICKTVKDCKKIIQNCISDPDSIEYLYDVGNSDYLLFGIGKDQYQYLRSVAIRDYEKGKKITIENEPFLLVNRERFNPKNYGIDYETDYSGIISFWFTGGKWKFFIYHCIELKDSVVKSIEKKINELILFNIN